jgi:hypothetical protein
MVTLDAGKANEVFAAAIERAASGKERVLIQREGETIAALVPIEDLQSLEANGDGDASAPGLAPADASQPDESMSVGESLLAMVERLHRDVPPEEWEKLPTDLSEQHDHYIYGTPKRQR